MKIIVSNQNDKLLIKLLPQKTINVIIPNYDGHDPCNRRNQSGVVEYIEFDLKNWDCTFKVVFNEVDNNNSYEAYFNFLVFTTELENDRIEEIKSSVETILERLANVNFSSYQVSNFEIEIMAAIHSIYLIIAN